MAGAKALRVGNGLDAATQMGPCISEGQLRTVEHQVRQRAHQRAVLHAGGLALGPVDEHELAPARAACHRPLKSVGHAQCLSGLANDHNCEPGKQRDAGDSAAGQHFEIIVVRFLRCHSS